MLSEKDKKVGNEGVNARSVRVHKPNGLRALCAVLGILSTQAFAAPNTFQVGTDTIHNTFTFPTFDTFGLAPDFVDTPAIFILGNTAGSNSCEVRLQNIDLDSFEAVCAEDSSWDGEHVDVPIQFAAITEGVKTIPTNNGGSVTFEVGCVGTNAVQHNCTTGCDTESYEAISFSAGFTNPPVVIANIQTVANATLGAPPSNPIQPMLSVAVDNIVAGGFDLALDLNKENNVGSLNDERICWLAVEETSRCDLAGTDDTLNFSSIGGPASVAFEAIITPDNIDGWDNGCNNTEEATFTPGCFTSTPVAIATKRGRQEAEGWLRYCTLNTGELRITIDEQRVTGQNRQHVDETASVVAFGSSFTTPVTLARFASRKSGSKHASFEWETEAESFNIGFNLWAELNGEWTQLNSRMIVSETDGLASGSAYAKKVRVGKNILENATAFGLSSYDNSGYEEFYGPFTLGFEYGEKSEFKPIDWSQIRAETDAKMRAAGYVKINGRWRKSNAARLAYAEKHAYQLNREVVDLSIAATGIYKLSYADVLNSGVDWNGLAIERLALTLKGKPVPRLINSENEVFDQGDEIIFYAPPSDADDALYTTEDVYRLQRSADKAVDASRFTTEWVESEPTASDHQVAYSSGTNSIYKATNTSGDPWLDRKILAYGVSASTTYEITIDEAIVEKPGRLTVTLDGGIDFPSIAEQNPDHHIVVKVNGTEVSDIRFDGFADAKIDVELAAGILNQGTNSVEITAPGDTGQLADIVYVDQVTLLASHVSALDAQSITIPAHSSAAQHQVELSNSDSSIRVFAYQKNGNFGEIETVQNNGGIIRFAGLSEVEPEDTAYTVIPESAFLSPRSIEPVRPINLSKGLQADYLIVAHPSFINEDLKRFAEDKNERGHETAIINWLDIIDTYGHGMATPTALKNFFIAADKRNSFEYALIVGGHSYDYNNNLELGNVNFIPTMYETVSKHFVYAPTDTPLVDLNSDGTPDKAIGRWPVRTEDDLHKIVNKTLKWQSQAHLYRDNVLLLADVSDTARGQNFANQLTDVVTAAGINTSLPNVSKVFLDDYIAMDTEAPIDDARIDLFNQFTPSGPGVGLTVFNGHSSSSRWTFRNLFSASDVSLLENSNAPTVVLPLACYTTLYESPSVNTLAHQLLFESEAGAVAISGSAYLSEYRENAAFAKRLIKRAKKTNMSIGNAILIEKRKMMSWNDMVTNWSLLGDPSLSLAD